MTVIQHPVLPAQRPGRIRLAPPGWLPAELAVVARTLVRPLTAEITRHVQDRVVEFRDTTTQEKEALEQATRLGITAFVELLERGPAPTPQVDDFYRRVGRAEAMRGRPLASLRSALFVASHAAWRSIHAKTHECSVPDSMLARIGDLLFAHIDRIDQQLTVGFRAGVRELEEDTGRRRTQLLHALLRGMATVDLVDLAESAEWPLPDQLHVAVIGSVPGTPVDLSLLPPTCLVAPGEPLSVVLVPVGQLERLRPRLLTAAGPRPVAISWAVPLPDAAAGLRWASRALELRHVGVLPPDRVIDCADHVTTLWLHAEPLMRERVVEGWLAPLLTLPPHTRSVLAETLLVMLETGGSAPAVAQRLGVHAQTVRYRRKRLRELFGAALDEPHDTVPLLLALRATLPLWENGRRAG